MSSPGSENRRSYLHAPCTHDDDDAPQDPFAPYDLRYPAEPWPCPGRLFILYRDSEPARSSAGRRFGSCEHLRRTNRQGRCDARWRCWKSKMEFVLEGGSLGHALPAPAGRIGVTGTWIAAHRLGGAPNKHA